MAKIAKVEQLGIEDAYDVTIDEHHNYIANNIVGYGNSTIDTKVFTNNGELTIERLHKDPYAAGKAYCDNGSGTLVVRDIQAVTHTGKKQIVQLTLDNGMTLQCTDDHKVLTTNRGYVMVKDLTDQDDIVTIDNYRKK
jgi:intein/homing endonuclease